MIAIKKTIKLFINGDFPRTESGRSLTSYEYNSKKPFAEICLASRKDLRSAVEAAKKAQKKWETKTAYNRSQILYRWAEMVETRRSEFVSLFQTLLGFSADKSNQEVDEAIEAIVYYSGFADKIQQVVGTINPVNGPHHNFTTAEPVGVVGILPQETFSFGEMAASLAASICSGNTVIMLLNEQCPALLAPLAETLATSDLPGGVVNLLTGSTVELAEHFGSHMEIHAVISLQNDASLQAKVRSLAVENLKRVVFTPTPRMSLEKITGTVEFKTVWHPVGY